MELLQGCPVAYPVLSKIATPPRPAGGGRPHLHREANHAEAVGWQRLQIVQLLQVTIADLATGLCSLLDQSSFPGVPIAASRG